MPTPLPRDEDGFVNTDSGFGHSFLVRVEYTTDFDGREIGEDEPLAQTLHGPFFTEAEANEWIEAYPDGDTDVDDFYVVNLNSVR